MLTFGEMVYVCALMGLCFFVCAVKVVFIGSGAFPEFNITYILLTFALFLGAILLYLFIRQKCEEYERAPKREAFLTVKKLKNASELVYIAVIIFIVPTLFDIFNQKYMTSVSEDFTYLFTSYPLWEVLLGLGVLVFGFSSYMRYYKTNKVFSALECDHYKEVPKSVYQTIKQYPTLEEYESGSTVCPAHIPAPRYENEEQERFLKENEVPIDDIDKRLAGLDVTGIRNGKPIYSKIDLASTAPGDNSLFACPFCGSLNTAEADECVFCGGKLDK